jgi:hypothetical protein
MTLAQWFMHYEHGGFPIKKAALGSRDLFQSCMWAANGKWLVRCNDCDLAEGAARADID